MSRVKGGYLGGIYDIPKKQPLDSRMLVTKKVDLINPSIWKTGGSPTGEFGHYNGMIVAVNSDGIYNGVYYLNDRNAITEDNYAAYKVALASGEDVSSYFAMWTKLGTVDDLVAISGELDVIKEQIGTLSPTGSLTPVDGTILITDDGKGIGVAIATDTNNALVAVEGGLFVPSLHAGVGIEIVDNQISVKLADSTHGLVAVDGLLMLNLVTHDSDGAMSKEDKIALDTVIEEVKDLKTAVSDLEESCVWGIW
jgi:hypothetical protein